jgi:hypothetical protein
MNLEEITRLEVIDSEGRSYTIWDADLLFSVQDEGRTLKIFASKKVKFKDE